MLAQPVFSPQAIHPSSHATIQPTSTSGAPTVCLAGALTSDGEQDLEPGWGNRAREEGEGPVAEQPTADRQGLRS